MKSMNPEKGKCSKRGRSNNYDLANRQVIHFGSKDYDRPFKYGSLTPLVQSK